VAGFNADRSIDLLLDDETRRKSRGAMNRMLDVTAYTGDSGFEISRLNKLAQAALDEALAALSAQTRRIYSSFPVTTS
jgi:hypothetical protein